MIRPVLFGLALMAATSASAEPDPRLASRLYSDSEVVRIDGRLGVQAAIAFAENEHIENVAIGDSNTWQVTPNKRANLLFVKPLAARARTNLTVVTDRRSYFFDLVASSSATPVYVLRFTYPPEPEKTPAQQAALSDDERTAMEGAPPTDPARLNFAWKSKGFQKLLPRRIYDDGSATYLAWGDRQDIPAILVRNDKGEEGPVNYAVRDGVIVINDVPERIVLRSGAASATLENMAAPVTAAGERARGSKLAAAEDTGE